MSYYNRQYFSDEMHYFTNEGERLEHRAKYGTADSVSEEKGTDNKKNNTSEYNHKYYESNKEKWEDNTSSSSSKKTSKSDDDDLYYDKDGNARFGHKDYDENDEDFKRTDGELINGTDLRTFTNKNGSTIIIGKGIKFSFPPGTKITTAMANKIAAIENGDKSNKESYVAKMLNAVTGFADRQKLNTDVGSTKKTSSKSKKSSSETKKEESKSSTSTKSATSTSNWSKIMKKYNGGDDEEKSSEELINEAQERGKAQTEYYKKKKS